MEKIFDHFVCCQGIAVGSAYPDLDQAAAALIDLSREGYGDLTIESYEVDLDAWLAEIEATTTGSGEFREMYEAGRL